MRAQSSKRARFGQFDVLVKASRIKRERRYSDVQVTRFDAEGNAYTVTVAAQRRKGSPDKWEPETVVKPEVQGL